MYIIIEPIQSGSFSTVYKAWCEQRQQYVALKVIPRQNYTNEIETMRMLGSVHPNICSMLDFYEDDSSYFLVLEYCEYGDLHDFMELSRRQGVQGTSIDLFAVIRQIYSALSFAHSLGIAHRDIKPENILLTKEGDAKLADWGHAIQSRWSNQNNIGTDAYRAPETFLDHNYDTFKADCWSFGVTILHLAFGQSPFRSLNHSKSFADLYQCSPSFLYAFYVKPLIESGLQAVRELALTRESPYPGRSSLGVDEITHLRWIVVDELLDIDPTRRNIDKFIGALDRKYHEQEASFQMSSTILLLPWTLTC